MTPSIMTSITLAGAYTTAMETAYGQSRRMHAAPAAPKSSWLAKLRMWMTRTIAVAKVSRA